MLLSGKRACRCDKIVSGMLASVGNFGETAGVDKIYNDLKFVFCLEIQDNAVPACVWYI